MPPKSVNQTMTKTTRIDRIIIVVTFNAFFILINNLCVTNVFISKMKFLAKWQEIKNHNFILLNVNGVIPKKDAIYCLGAYFAACL